jgi:hypothetical protein
MTMAIIAVRLTLVTALSIQCDSFITIPPRDCVLER